jgi:glycyl-tRNA synthetase alpha chain
MYLQDVEDVYALRWSESVPYGDVRREEEYQLSRYSFELADTNLHRRGFESALGEGWRLLGVKGDRAYLPAYDWCLRSSHAFNVLDARGAISVTERAAMILSIRKLACAVAKAYVEALTGTAATAEAGEVGRG